MKTTLYPFMLIALFALVSCGTGNDTTTATDDATELSGSNKGQAFVASDGFDKNVLEIAIGNEDFSTLVAAVQAAGVENALVNAGPLTVFAPTNDAFAKLPEGTVEELVKPENQAKLAFILTHHVAPANFPIKTLAKNAEKGRLLGMASGQYLEVTQDGDDIYVGGTKILATVNASNGIIHVVGDVILPKE